MSCAVVPEVHFLYVAFYFLLCCLWPQLEISSLQHLWLMCKWLLCLFSIWVPIRCNQLVSPVLLLLVFSLVHFVHEQWHVGTSFHRRLTWVQPCISDMAWLKDGCVANHKGYVEVFELWNGHKNRFINHYLLKIKLQENIDCILQVFVSFTPNPTAIVGFEVPHFEFPTTSTAWSRPIL